MLECWWKKKIRRKRKNSSPDSVVWRMPWVHQVQLCGECLEFTKFCCVENALIEFTSSVVWRMPWVHQALLCGECLDWVHQVLLCGECLNWVFCSKLGRDHAASGVFCFFHFCRGHLLYSLCGDGCVAILWVCFHPPRINCLLVWSVYG